MNEKFEIRELVNQSERRSAWALIEPEPWMTFSIEQWHCACELEYCTILVAHAKQDNEAASLFVYCAPDDVSYAYVGPIITSAKYRKQGLAMMLFEKMMVDVKQQSRIITLHSVGQQTAKYRATHTPFPGETSRLGFIYSDDLEKIANAELEKPHNRTDETVLCRSYDETTDFEDIVKFDKSISNRSRERELHLMFHTNTFETFVARNSSSELIGFMVLQPLKEQKEEADRQRIGPLYANSKHVALCLMQLAAIRMQHRQRTQANGARSEVWFRFQLENTQMSQLIAENAGEFKLTDFILERSSSAEQFCDSVDSNRIWFISGMCFMPEG